MTEDTPTRGFAALLGGRAERARAIQPDFYDVVSRFWETPFRSGALDQKVKELVALAVHAAGSTLHAPGVALHVRRALQAGATEAEVADVLTSIAPLGVHTFAVAIPALVSELAQMGSDKEATLPAMTDEMRRIKDEFVERRGYWTDQREMLASLVPEFFKSYMALSSEPWRAGALDAKTRELMLIAIDCSITHMYEHGLRIHIRNALKHGAKRDEILEVFEIAATLGSFSYTVGMTELFDAAAP